ncbi:alpha/beta hydrolase [Sphingomonas sp. Leaf357]|uniref:alpha/beta fold hydrolase n=1 Tax=Sphingomonas sp. Leaf357 TaxID=1736350 RepID=UPI0006FF1471|nr:alpha/beta fold hydrolase [Sphingomonas sp. Leaf357]KQS03740.1 alpha/beta hydrolase [Sphingomonas sp. Leaf357]
MLLPLVLALIAPVSTPAELAKPRNRAEATAVIRDLRRIVTPNGIERAERVRIGGIDQYVNIRGTDRRNPVLLILHGGPGFPETPLAWWNTRTLEEYFTIVEWDQRGSGKTYLMNDPDAVAATMKPERFVSDAEELVGWLRKDLHKQKVFVLGHSWGSYVGLELARRRPEWLHAYIGTGQATNSPESERRGFAATLAAAKAARNETAITELETIIPYASPGAVIPLKDIALERKWSDFFGGAMAFRNGQSDGIAARLSPDYTDEEAMRVYDGNDFSQKYLFSSIVSLNLSTLTELKCPLILFEGRYDRTVNSALAHEWFERVRAPSKQFVWFENSAHEVMSEEPGKVLVSLLRYARPIAERAGDGPPS